MNDHSKDSQTRYLREAAIVLAREGFQTIRTQTGRLRVLLDGTPLCELAESGVTYRNEDVNEQERIDAKDKVYGIVTTTAEYMRQMETAPALKADGLEDGYKVLADFNGTALAGVQSKHGVHFVTWDWAYGHTGITLRIYTRQVTPPEEKRIIQNAANKNRMNRSNTNDLQQTITAESNLQDVAALVAGMHRNREPLLHCAVYIELTASDYNNLKLLQTDVLTELVRSKLNVDRLLLRQQQGFCCASPVGYNAFGQQFERVLPASSVANLYPFNYSGKTDAKGFYIGKDKYGSNILVDFDQRDEDKTSANILILGNSGQGKSYLMKLIILNLLESVKAHCWRSTSLS